MHFNVKEDIIQLTSLWKGERSEDGRPRVADADIAELKKLTQEQIWEPLWELGYKNQFEAHLYRIHDDNRKLIGRAVTAAYMPTRPDLFQMAEEIGHSEGRKGTHNLWVIDNLSEGDVAVIDMYDKIYEGTFMGGNLSTATAHRTKTGGAVIWGGIRDMEQINKIDNIQIYYRGNDPTPIKDFVITGYNTPVRIGGAVCLPGDIVYGYRGGVIFIPAHLVKYILDEAKKPHVKDIFGFEMLEQNRYNTAEIDLGIWPQKMLDELMEFIAADPRAEAYRGLDWSKEYAKAKETYGKSEQP